MSWDIGCALQRLPGIYTRVTEMRDSINQRTGIFSTDVSFVKTVSLEIAILGRDLTYTVVASNLGTVTATGVTVTDVLPVSLEPASATSTGIFVTDDLPDDLSLISAIPTQGICSSYPDVVCELGQSSPADSAEVSVKASIAVSMRGQLVNTVVASSTAPKTYWGTTPPRR